MRVFRRFHMNTRLKKCDGMGKKDEDKGERKRDGQLRSDSRQDVVSDLETQSSVAGYI